MLALSTKQSVNFAASLAGVSFVAALFGIATIFSDIADLESELSRHQSYYLNVSNTMWKELMDQSEEIRISHSARRQRRQYDSGYKAGGGGGAKPSKCPGGPKGPKGPPGERGMDGSDGLPGLPGNGASISTDPYSGAPQVAIPGCGPCPQGPQGLPGYKGKRGQRGDKGPKACYLTSLQALRDYQEPTATLVKKGRKAISATKETREVQDKRARLERTQSAMPRARLERRVNAAIRESLVMKDCQESAVMTQASVHQAHKDRPGLQENRARTESKVFQARQESQVLTLNTVHALVVRTVLLAAPEVTVPAAEVLAEHLADHPVARRAAIAVAALLPVVAVVRAATAAVPLPLPHQHQLPREVDMVVLQAVVAVVAQIRTMALHRVHPRYNRLRERRMCRKSVAAAIKG
ncbi:nematode cuticle collagen domain-containing protein [Aphelenchoides avenae]|nr:nematode cuticle collagen domain-containing protein [Aphelenchus avenae]